MLVGIQLSPCLLEPYTFFIYPHDEMGTSHIHRGGGVKQFKKKTHPTTNKNKKTKSGDLFYFIWLKLQEPPLQPRHTGFAKQKFVGYRSWAMFMTLKL